MGTLTYKKMSLFDAPKGSVIAHGCNAQGVWGRGIAVPFKANFPNAFKEYNHACEYGLKINPEHGIVGTTVLTKEENGYRVGCLITSTNFGKKNDKPGTIIVQTILALRDLLGYLNTYELKTEPIYSNKFNSGLFKVPWGSTEKVIKYFCERYDINWIVCDPDLE